MWGWKTVERLIDPSVSFSEAKQRLEAEGFRLHTSNAAHAVLKSRGTQSAWTTMTPQGENLPIELALASAATGLYLQLRYETFVLFDTGDLSEFADTIADLLRPDAASADSDPHLQPTQA